MQKPPETENCDKASPSVGRHTSSNLKMQYAGTYANTKAACPSQSQNCFTQQTRVKSEKNPSHLPVPSGKAEPNTESSCGESGDAESSKHSPQELLVVPSCCRTSMRSKLLRAVVRVDGGEETVATAPVQLHAAPVVVHVGIPKCASLASIKIPPRAFPIVVIFSYSSRDRMIFHPNVVLRCEASLGS